MAAESKAFESKACAEYGEVVQPGPAGDGRTAKLGDFDLYEVGSGDRVVVLLYDIFGFASPNNRANCDAFAAAGFRVLMPDFFRGGGKAVNGWERPPDEAAKQDLQRTLEHVEGGGAKQIALFGICWGGRQALLAASCELYPFSACGGCHCSGMEAPQGAAIAEGVRCPIIMLQASNDPDLRPVVEVVQNKDFASRCVLRTFFDQPHGFAGTRGDRRDPFVAAAARQAIQTGIDFCNQRMLGS